MQGLGSVWQALSASKRIMLVGAVGATIIAFTMLARTVSTPTMALLYSGLDTDVAGEVISSLEQMGAHTEVRGDAIYVPADRRDSLRMALAREGLPQQGQAGYELLQELSGFSTTSDMFNVTYWRAVEGELARTILATPGVRAARVHIAQQRSGAFSRNGAEPKGVVTVTMGRGALTSAQANSIRYVVASAVPRLAAEQVAVIDADRGVILSPGTLDDISGAQADAADRERKIERDLLDLLEARVGAGNARVQVAMEIDTEREAVMEKVYDPNGRVMAGKQTTEVTESSTGGSGGSITVASNLPEGDGNANGSQSASEKTQTDESVSYELSEIRREREKAPGAVKRLSVAVLINNIETTADDGSVTFTPRPDEELTALRELASNAVGLDETRGDTLTIQAMPFQPIENDGILVEQSFVSDFMERHLMTVVQIAVLSIVTLILGLFVVKPLLSTAPAPQAVAAAGPAVESAAAPAELIAQHQDPMETLKGLANDRTDETATLIKSWLEEGEEAA